MFLSEEDALCVLNSNVLENLKSLDNFDSWFVSPYCYRRRRLRLGNCLVCEYSRKSVGDVSYSVDYYEVSSR